ncbi:MAG: iron-containing redox enzyme family protein [Pseudobdellovibrio sp.]
MNPTLTPKTVYNEMLVAIDRIAHDCEKFAWHDEQTYANWLAQSYYYVSWTTRQLALASARTKPGTEDTLHWRFIEEAKEEKKHELLALKDLKALGYELSMFPELPHTAFFYQSLSYMIENEHPIAILGFSLTLEGFAAKKAHLSYPKVLSSHGQEASTFMRLHCEVDVEHFSQALPHLESCPTHLLPIISRGIQLCTAIYCGILNDITLDQAIRNQTHSIQTETSI